MIQFCTITVRFEETNEFTTTCKKEENQTCIGGYARAINVIKNLKTIRTNPIYLNVGDNFAGTIWYTIGRWNVTSQFLNLYNADAMVGVLFHCVCVTL